MSREVAGAEPSYSGPQTFQRRVALLNPGSTQFALANEFIDDFEANCGEPIERVYTHPTYDATRSTLAGSLQLGDLLIACGGDTTANVAARSLTEEELSRLHIAMVPLGTGNGNDLSNILNGRNAGERLAAIIRQANVITVYPITCETEQPPATDDEDDEWSTNQLFAANSLGFGLTGGGSHTLNLPRYRKLPLYRHSTVARLGYDSLVVAYHTGRNRPFGLRWKEGVPDHFATADEEIELHDLSVVNGPRMAKRCQLPVELTEHRLFVHTIPADERFAAARNIAKLATGHAAGDYLGAGEMLPFTLTTPVRIHEDGSDSTLPAGTRVSITQGKVPFYALSMKAAHPATG